jgi:hypothetical protein
MKDNSIYVNKSDCSGFLRNILHYRQAYRNMLSIDVSGETDVKEKFKNKV